MKKILPTVTVGLSALNEQKNIKKLLKSVLSQKQESFDLKKIIVISDGSSDKTVEYAKSLGSKKITVKSYKTRKGKASRLNNIFSNLKTDILIQVDADSILANKYVLENLIFPFIQDKKIAMTGGLAVPKVGETLIEKSIATTVNVYTRMKHKVDSLSVNGCLLAYRSNFIKKIKLPENVHGDDIYTYLSCLSKGYKYRFVPEAIVNYKLPNTLSDHIKQNTRFLATPDTMQKYFSSDLLNKENHIPRGIFISEIIKEFLHHPFLCSYIGIVNIYCKFKLKFSNHKMTSKWSIAKSTK